MAQNEKLPTIVPQTKRQTNNWTCVIKENQYGKHRKSQANPRMIRFYISLNLVNQEIESNKMLFLKLCTYKLLNKEKSCIGTGKKNTFIGTQLKHSLDES